MPPTCFNSSTKISKALNLSLRQRLPVLECDMDLVWTRHPKWLTLAQMIRKLLAG